MFTGRFDNYDPLPPPPMLLALIKKNILHKDGYNKGHHVKYSPYKQIQ